LRFVMRSAPATSGSSALLANLLFPTLSLASPFPVARRRNLAQVASFPGGVQRHRPFGRLSFSFMRGPSYSLLFLLSRRREDKRMYARRPFRCCLSPRITVADPVISPFPVGVFPPPHEKRSGKFFLLCSIFYCQWHSRLVLR